MDNNLCCEKCFEKLYKQNPKGAKLWCDLCDIFREYGVFGLVTYDFENLTFLEKKRMIVTTDYEDMIVIKVKTKRDGILGTYYCGDNCNG